jgi:prepilin-type N-terminal cleavage/methylation domain-containing protein
MNGTTRNAGFTLLEVLLALAISGTVMLTIGTTFSILLSAREVVDELAESTEAGPRILNLIERDLHGLWTFNVGNNAVFRGRDMDVGSFEADRMDFLTTTDAVGFVIDNNGVPRKPTVCEVGYWFKQNPKYRDLIEMWRREDPMVDNELITQGSFQLVHDRLKNFKVTYYKTLGHEAEELLEWDSSAEDMLPRRIKIEFTIERRRGSRNVVSDAEIEDFEEAEKTYVRHFVFDQGTTTILRAGTAMIPLLPPEPVTQESGGPVGPAGPGGPSGPSGPAGSGRSGKPGSPVAVQTTGSGRGTATGAAPGTSTTTFGGRGQAPNGLPPGFNLGELLRGNRGGSSGGGLFGNR